MRKSKYHILLKNTLKYKKTVFIGMLLVLIQPFVVVQIPMKVKEAFDNVIPNKNTEGLINVIIIISIMFISGKIIEYITDILFYEVNCKIVKNIRIELFDKVINSKINDLNKFESADIITRVEEDIKNIGVFFVNNIANMLSDTLSLFFALYMMMKLSYILGVIMLCLLLIYILISKKFRKLIGNLSGEYIKTISKSKSVLIDAIKNVEIIKINRYNSFILELYNKTVEDKKIANINLGKCRLKGTVIIESLLNYFPYIIIFLGGMMVFKDYFTVGSIIAFIEYSKRAISNLENISNYNFDISKSNVSLKRINEIYNMDREVVTTMEIDKPIVFNNIYVEKDNKIIIDNLNIKIKNNMKLAIWGLSGSGKTTFSRVLLGLDDEYVGTINFEGEDLRFSFNGGFLKSEPYIIDGTLKDNILMGKIYEEKKYKDALDISRLAGIDDERNVLSCSHGEKQKICLARILYLKPSIILIDEGLSNIDAIDLECIIDNLLGIKNITILMITHNLDIIEKYNYVMHFDKDGIMIKDIKSFKNKVSKINK